VIDRAEETNLKGKTILVVDDEEAIRKIIKIYLSELEVSVVFAESAASARDCLAKFNIDLILSDIAMPGGETGIDLLGWCRTERILAPFILLSGFISAEDVRYAFSKGVQHVIHKPFKKIQLIEAVLSSFAISDAYGNLLNSYIKEIELNQQLFMAAIDGFAAAIGARDGYTLQHSEQVAEYAVLFSRKIGLDEKNIQIARIAGKLHDIGKIGVPENILLKKGTLTEAEFKIMKSHPAKAAEILGSLPSLASVIDGARHHHEKFDGTGYPDGLKGMEIPLMGRILAICDAFSAMTTERPYRSAIPPGKARDEIRANVLSHFDPELAAAFLSIPEIAEA